jgi:hypothetical protein
MKKLTPKQMFDLVDFLSDCYQDYEDDYSLRAVNNTLKIMGYSNEFHYDYENDSVICDGGIE